ncbi:MAG: DUF4249 family protein [Flavobacteriaceae bacterium]
MKTHIFPMLVLAALCSCGDDVVNVSDNFVLEGYLTANRPVDQIRLKETFGLEFAEDPNIPIADASIVLSKNNEEYPLTFNPDKASYEYTDHDLEVASDDVFYIEIGTGDRIATAQTRVPRATQGLTVSTQSIGVPTITVRIGIQQVLVDLFATARFILKWDNPNQDDYFIVVEKLTGTQPIFPADFPIPEETLALIQSFSTVSRPLTTDTYEIPALSLESYGTYRATVYRINQEYVDLFNSQTQDSRDLAEAPSNVNNALGIFTAIAGAHVDFEVVRQ